MNTSSQQLPTRRSLALDIDLPDAPFALTNLTATRGREGHGVAATVRAGGPRGRIIGEFADYGDGGGSWPRVSRQESDFWTYLAQVPDVYHLDAPSSSEEWSVNTLLIEAELLRDLKRASKKGCVFIVGDASPWEANLGTVNAPDSPATRDWLRSQYHTDRIRVWSPTDGWVTLPKAHQ